MSLAANKNMVAVRGSVCGALLTVALAVWGQALLAMAALAVTATALAAGQTKRWRKHPAVAVARLRRGDMDQFARLLAEFYSRAEPFSLVLFRIDRSHRFARRSGRAGFGSARRQVAELARRLARERETIAVAGRDTFAWLMPAADQNMAAGAAERLRWIVEAGTLSAPCPAVTISAGVATSSAAPPRWRCWRRRNCC